jgi:hypothetical protein
MPEIELPHYRLQGQLHNSLICNVGFLAIPVVELDMTPLSARVPTGGVVPPTSWASAGSGRPGPPCPRVLHARRGPRHRPAARRGGAGSRRGLPGPGGSASRVRLRLVASKLHPADPSADQRPAPGPDETHGRAGQYLAWPGHRRAGPGPGAQPGPDLPARLDVFERSRRSVPECSPATTPRSSHIWDQRR